MLLDLFLNSSFYTEVHYKDIIVTIRQTRDLVSGNPWHEKTCLILLFEEKMDLNHVEANQYEMHVPYIQNVYH